MSEADDKNRSADTLVRECSGREECLPSETVQFRALCPDQEITISPGKLPHWEQNGACQFVTFRLGDSIPVSTTQQWKQEREQWEHYNPKPWNKQQRLEFGQRFVKRDELLLDRGLGDCHLRNADLRRHVRDSIIKFNGERYDIDVFVIMPNHVHLLFQLREGFKLAQELKGIKGASARRCNATLGCKGTFWQAESWDRMVRNATELRNYRTYIEENPAAAGLRDDDFRLEIYHALEIER